MKILIKIFFIFKIQEKVYIFTINYNSRTIVQIFKAVQGAFVTWVTSDAESFKRLPCALKKQLGCGCRCPQLED